MAEFSYIARTAAGRRKEGLVEARSRADACAQLRRQALCVVTLKRRRLIGDGWSLLPWLASRRDVLRSRDVELVLRQLSVMLQGGMELSVSLRELSRFSGNRRQARWCEQLALQIAEGETFSAALRTSIGNRPLAIELARVGEESGELAIMLQRAAEFLERRRRALAGLLAAFAYPGVVAVAACSVAVYMIGWTIPKVSTFLFAMGRQLPPMTQSLLVVADSLRLYGPGIMVGTAAAIVAGTLIYRWPVGRRKCDQWLLRLPLVGEIWRISETQQLASALALMLRSGVFLPDALGVVSALHRNQHLRIAVQQAQESLTAGNELAASLSGAGFPGMLTSMVAVGERSDSLPLTLDQVGKYYEDQLASKLNYFGRLVEPVTIVLVGGIVGYVYIAFFMALMSAGGKF